MSLKMIMGFDLVPGGLYTPGQNVFPFSPINGRGLEPYMTQYGITNNQVTGAANVYGSIGVTDRNEDKFAHGANALVFYSYSTAYLPYLSFAGTGRVMSAAAPFRYTIGFRFKIDSGSPATMIGQSCLISILGTALLVLGTDYKFSLFSTVTTFTPVRGVEYYIELTLDYPTAAGGTGNFTPNITLSVDGTDVLTKAGPTWSGSVLHQWNIGFITRAGSGGVASSVRWLLGDFYVTDLVGEAPYNGRMGPQRIRTAYPDEVVANTWGLSEGTDPLALIGKAAANDDAKFLLAPDDEGLSSYRLGLPTNPKSVITGLAIYGRAKREDTASRKLAMDVTKAGGGSIATNAGVTLTNAFAHYSLAQVFPGTAAEAVNLKDDILQNAVFSFKAPAS